MRVLDQGALLIERPALLAMLTACRAALPREACGLLGGRRGIASSHVAVANVAEEPELRFEMDPEELAAAMAELEARGEELVAVYHSHPRTSPVPSWADVRACLWPRARYVIVGYAGGREQVRAFHIHGARRAVECRWLAVDPPRARTLDWRGPGWRGAAR